MVAGGGPAAQEKGSRSFRSPGFVSVALRALPPMDTHEEGPQEMQVSRQEGHWGTMP